MTAKHLKWPTPENFSLESCHPSLWALKGKKKKNRRLKPTGEKIYTLIGSDYQLHEFKKFV